MKNISTLLVFCMMAFLISSCSTYTSPNFRQGYYAAKSSPVTPPNYASRLPSHSPSGGKMILVDPNVHAWGAYDTNGSLIKAGLASAGADYCPDLGHRCHTKSGTFNIYSLGSPDCKSKIFPIGRGGAPMPYCMFFNDGQALHGVPDFEVVEGNVSHGCVRLHVYDAEWIRYNFATIGTRVTVSAY